MPYIPDYPYRMLKIGGSGSGKATGLLNLITEHYSESLIDKIYLYAKDLKETKIPMKRHEIVGIKHLKIQKYL